MGKGQENLDQDWSVICGFSLFLFFLALKLRDVESWLLADSEGDLTTTPGTLSHSGPLCPSTESPAWSFQLDALSEVIDYRHLFSLLSALSCRILGRACLSLGARYSRMTGQQF